MNSVTNWNYKKSVEKMIPLVRNWKNVTIEMLDELYRARKELDSRGGYRHGQKSNVPNGTFEKGWREYLNDIGLSKSTVHRWLAKYDPVTKTLKEIEPPKEQKKEPEYIGHEELEKEKEEEEQEEDIEPDIDFDFDDDPEEEPESNDSELDFFTTNTDPNKAIKDIDTYIDDVLEEIEDYAGKHYVVNEILKKLKRLSGEYNRQSIGAI